MIIQIDFSVPHATLARVEQLLRDTAERDVDFNGASITIQRGDGTCVTDSGGIDPYDVQRLFETVQEEIAGTRDLPAGKRKLSNGEMFEV